MKTIKQICDEAKQPIKSGTLSVLEVANIKWDKPPLGYENVKFEALSAVKEFEDGNGRMG